MYIVLLTITNNYCYMSFLSEYNYVFICGSEQDDNGYLNIWSCNSFN